MAASAPLSDDPWLSKVMGKRVFRVDGALGAPELASLARPGTFAYGKVDTHDVKRLADLQRAGFFLVDTNVTLSLEGDGPSAPPPAGLRVRFAERNESPEGVASVAGLSFTFSRFHLDPLVDRALANRIKSEWAANFFRGARGDALVVAEAEGRVVGFLLALRSGNRTVIDLIATHPDWQGKGAGQAMIAKLREKFGPAIDVGTQLANLASLRFYQKLGFRVSNAKYVLHYHSPGAA